MITKKDEADIAERAVLLPDQTLTNRAFLLGCAYICHSLYNLRIEHSRSDDLPDGVLDVYDEIYEKFIKEYTIDEERKIDPELRRE